jgi:Na+-driven multidrug efflux pump
MKKERLFTNRQLLTLLWPLIIEQMLEILVGMADTVMVSSVGEAAISGVSLVDMINQLIITLFGALATGGAVVTSQHLGAKRPEDAAKSAGQLVGLSAILGVGVAAFCLITRTAQLRLFFGTITDEVMQACLTYFTITALSFPFLALYNAGAAIFRSTGNSAVSMKVSVIVNGINFCGNALCVFVLKMGVAGVAVPTLISRAVGACIILALAARQDYQLRITPQSVTRFEGRTVKSILHIGKPDPSAANPNDVSATEGDALSFTVKLSNASSTSTSFDFVLKDGTATSDDYGSATFSNGVTYDAATGTFATIAGQIAVPAATYTQETDGTYTVTPGTTTVTVTGTV